MKEWQNKIAEFETMDVRGRKLDFFNELRAKASSKVKGEGLHIIQTFEPYPLYAVMKLMGFEHFTEKLDDNEYHAYFYKK